MFTNKRQTAKQKGRGHSTTREKRQKEIKNQRKIRRGRRDRKRYRIRERWKKREVKTNKKL